SHELGDTKRVGQPFQLDAVFFLELEQPLVGDEGVGALVVGVDAYARLFHAASWLVRFSRGGSKCLRARDPRCLMSHPRRGAHASRPWRSASSAAPRSP